MQLEHHNTTTLVHNLEIVLLCDNITSPANIGSLFRIADSFGVSRIFFAGSKIDVSSSRLKRTARATQNKVAFQDTVDAYSCLNNLINEGFTSISLEITDKSTSIKTFTNNNKSAKIVLIIGNESAGVSDKLLEKCEHHVHINMFGQNSSMNVVQATAISLYELTKNN